YGLMQAYAEGYDILRNKNSKSLAEDQRFELNLPDIAEVWRRGSVISSWLLDLRVRLRALSRIAELLQHEADGRKFQKREGVAVEIFPILGETTAPVEPSD